jgi:hypothetical protein
MKLKLDENLGELGRDVLTAQGHDVSTVAKRRLSVVKVVLLDQGTAHRQDYSCGGVAYSAAIVTACLSVSACELSRGQSSSCATC